MPKRTMWQDDSLPASWSEDVLVQSSPNFQHTPRISAINPPEVVIAKILEHEESGIPLIVEDWHKRPDWDYARFSIEGFLEGPTQLISVRNVQTTEDIQMRLDDLISHYQDRMRKNLIQENTLYGKDLPCPTSWEQWIRNVLPEHCHPLGSNDLFSHLSAQELPESLMCYIGVGDTFTPAHKDPCGSFGHNIMCYASENGSAFWFMSETGHLDEDLPSIYFREKLDTDLDLESRKVTVEEFREASFTVYCAKQRLGDLVLVPPRSCHQVVNAGGITIKMSWSRMGVKSLEYALHSELLLYHRICRPETYRVKLTVFRVLQAYAQQLSDTTADEDLPFKSLKIIDLFDEILVEEWSPDYQTLPTFGNDDTDKTFFYSCDFCGADIFQSLFACTRCSNPDGTNMYTSCPSCYVEGRSCLCGAEYMKPYQTVPFASLIEERNKATTALGRHFSKPPIAREWTPTIKGSSHIPIFKAACLYRAHVLGSINKDDDIRCNIDKAPDHYCHPTLVLRCSPCYQAVCFRHNLECRDIHSAEGMLIYELGHFEWHERHMFRPDTQVRVTPRSVNLYHGEHSKRLARAALNSRRCRPLDSRRSLPGFYDKWVLVGTRVGGNDQSSKECISYLQLDDDSSASSSPPASSRVRDSSPLHEFDDRSPPRLHWRSRPSRLSYSDPNPFKRPKSTFGNAFKRRTVVSIPSCPSTTPSSPQVCNSPRELSVDLFQTGVEQSEEVPITPIQVKHWRKDYRRPRRIFDANISSSSSHATSRIGPPKGAKRLKRVGSSVVTPNHISSGEKKLRSSPPAVPRTPATPTPPVAPTPKPKSYTLISEFQGIVKALHPGDAVSRCRMMEEFQATDDPQGFLTHLLRKAADDYKRIQHELHEARIEKMANKFETSYAKDVPSVSEYKALQDQCQWWKKLYHDIQRETIQLEATLEMHNRVRRNTAYPPLPTTKDAEDVHPWSDSNRSHPSTMGSGYESVLQSQDVGVSGLKDAWGSQDARRDSHQSSWVVNQPSTTETRYKSFFDSSSNLNWKDTWGRQDPERDYHRSRYVADQPLVKRSQQSSEGRDKHSRDTWGSQNPNGDNDQTWLCDRVEQTAFREHERSSDVDCPLRNRFRATRGRRNNRNSGTSHNTSYRDNRHDGEPGCSMEDNRGINN